MTWLWWVRPLAPAGPASARWEPPTPSDAADAKSIELQAGDVGHVMCQLSLPTGLFLFLVVIFLPFFLSFFLSFLFSVFLSVFPSGAATISI